MNSEVMQQLLLMSMNVGTGGLPVYIGPNGMADSPHGRLMGRPAFETDHCAALGDTGDIIWADFSDYVLVTKGSTLPKTAMSVDLRFLYDETAWKMTWRRDGRSKWDRPMTPRKGSQTVSQYVMLDERA